MKRFVIAAVAALAFGAPAMAQSHGGYGGQPYYGQQPYQGDAHARGYNGSGYEQREGHYSRRPSYDYDHRGYNGRAARHERQEERRHERRERHERRGGHGYYGY